MPWSSRSISRRMPSRWRSRTPIHSGLDVEVAQGDLLEPVPADLRGSVDLVVSNPPYVEEHELSALPREVLADPMLALAGGIERL